MNYVYFVVSAHKDQTKHNRIFSNCTHATAMGVMLYVVIMLNSRNSFCMIPPNNLYVQNILKLHLLKKSNISNNVLNMSKYFSGNVGVI